MTAMTITRDDASAAFFDGTARGVLLLRRCDDCGRRSAPRTLTCAACHSARLAWEPARGTGTLASWTVVHHRPAGGAPAPRTIAGLVQLDEGPWLHARIDGIDPSRLRAGLPLTVAFDRPADGEAIPVFQSAESVETALELPESIAGGAPLAAEAVTHLMLKAAEDGEEAVAWAENYREWQRIKTTCDAQEGPRVRGEACTAVDRHLIHDPLSDNPPSIQRSSR